MAEEGVRRRLAAILAADVVGYSHLIECDEEGTRARLRRLLAEVIEPLVAASDGRVVKTTGDGVLVEFASAVDAVRRALEIQAAVAGRDRALPPDRQIVYRIGVNLGDVIVEGDDIHGEGVNVAARLEGLCAPGEVYVSQGVYDQVSGKLNAAFDDLGEWTVRNIARPVRAYRVRAGLPQAAPVAAAPLLPVSGRPSIAVLPFANLSGDPAQDYLADGLRLAIQAQLVKLSGLFLVAPAGVAAYRDRAVSADQAARELGVHYVLEGAAQRARDRIRITVQLTDAEARRAIWAERYDRDLVDTLAIQDEITAAVVTNLDVKLVSGDSYRRIRSSLTNTDALDAFYRGLSLFYERSRENTLEARQYFKEVARLQPDSPVGPTYIASTYLVELISGWAEPVEPAIEQAVAWAEKAAAFPVTNGMADMVLAFAHLQKRRFEEALESCYKAVCIRPNCPAATSYLANVLHFCGRSEEAIAWMTEAMQLTPVYPPWFLTTLAAAYRDSGDVATSISTAEKALQDDRRNLDTQLVLCTDFEMLGRASDASKAAQEVVSIDPAFSVARYAARQPYKDEQMLRRLAASLRNAGLPE